MSDTGISRRAVMGVAAGTLAAASVSPSDAAASRAFPRGFLWGAATAGHQIEGNNVNSDMWLTENVRPTYYMEPSGDACDSLHRWPEDLDLVREIGLSTYRFSIE